MPSAIGPNFGERHGPLALDPSTPIVVLGSTDTSLNVARSLGRLGVEAILARPPGFTPARYSRYWKATAVWDTGNGVEPLLAIGQAAGRSDRRPLLIPTSDPLVMFVAENATALAGHFRFARLDPATAQSLMNKREMARLAATIGIATPRSVYPETITDAMGTLDSLPLPCVAKSIDSRRRNGAFKRIIRTECDLLAALRVIDISNLMLQEYVPGDDTAIWMFNGCFDETSRCLLGFTGRKLRQWPPYRGVTSLGISESNALIEELTQRLAVATGYNGPIDIGYRYDLRDREYKLLDVNPRIGGTFRLFVGQEGLDVIRAHYLHLTGQPVPASVPRLGRKWLREEDLVGGWRYLRDGKLTLAGWVRSLRGVEETAWYAGDDPVPALLRPIQVLCAGAATPIRRSRGS